MLMKRLLLLLPLLLTACGGAADITTEKSFQIICTWTRGEKSGDETWFIDPKLDMATIEVESEDGESEDVDYAVRKVTPRKIVLGDEWYQLFNEDGFMGDWNRNEASIDRSTGELTLKRIEVKSATSYLSAGRIGDEIEPSFEYDCKKPTRD